MQDVVRDRRLDLGDLSDLMVQRLGVLDSTVEALATPATLGWKVLDLLVDPIRRNHRTLMPWMSLLTAGLAFLSLALLSLAPAFAIRGRAFARNRPRPTARSAMTVASARWEIAVRLEAAKAPPRSSALPPISATTWARAILRRVFALIL